MNAMSRKRYSVEIDEARLEWLLAAIEGAEDNAGKEFFANCEAPPLSREEAEKKVEAILAAAAESARQEEDPDDSERHVLQGVDDLRMKLSAHARQEAVRQLRYWNTRGVDWFSAKSGWVLRATSQGTLASVAGATFNSARRRLEYSMEGEGVIPQTYRTREGFVTHDVSQTAFRSGIHESTRSEIAVPIIAPDRSVLGVYNLESDQEGVFTSAQIRELKNNVSILVPHLLVLRDADDPSHTQWAWHPDRAGWSQSRQVTQLCDRISKLLSRRGEPRPATAIWIADPAGKAWTLGTSGYDAGFMNRFFLTEESAVGRAIANPGEVLRGTPRQLQFKCVQTAARMGVQYCLIVPLHRNSDEPIRGSLNIYFFDERGEYPSDALVRALARQAEKLLQDYFAARRSLALAYLRCELARSTSLAASFEIYRKTVMEIMRVQAMSLFVREPNTDILQCVDSSGFEDLSDPTRARYYLNQPIESRTVWLARNPGEVLRFNWGPQDKGNYHHPDLPQTPSNLFRERITVDESYHRRFLGCAIHNDAKDMLGVVRMIRSQKAPPFTEQDEQLLRDLLEEAKTLIVNLSYSRSNRIGPSIDCNIRLRLGEFLQSCVAWFGERSLRVAHASVSVRGEGDAPHYRLFAYHSPSRQLPPHEELAELSLSLIGPGGWKYAGKITVSPCIDPKGNQVTRLCVPLMIWSGPHLVEALLAVDFLGEDLRFPDPIRAKVFDIATTLAALWANNIWDTDRELLNNTAENIVTQFEDFCASISEENVASAHVSFYTAQSATPGASWVPCPDPDLGRFGVKLSTDGTRCTIPLLLGPYRIGELFCDFDEKFAAQLKPAVSTEGRAKRHRGDSQAAEPVALDKQSLETLRNLAASATGAWCRIAVCSLPYWKVDLSKEYTEGDMTVWDEQIEFTRYSPDLTATQKRSAEGGPAKPGLLSSAILDRGAMDDAVNYRFMVETYMASKLAQNWENNALQELERICQETDAMLKEPLTDEWVRRFSRLDGAFHVEICHAARCDIAKDSVSLIYEATNPRSFRCQKKAEAREIAKEHRQILAAIQARAIPEILAAFQTHLQISANRVTGSHVVKIRPPTHFGETLATLESAKPARQKLGRPSVKKSKK